MGSDRPSMGNTSLNFGFQNFGLRNNLIADFRFWIADLRPSKIKDY